MSRGGVTLPMQHAAWVLAFAADYALPRATGATVVTDIIRHAAPQLDADARTMVARDIREGLDRTPGHHSAVPASTRADWQGALDAVDATPDLSTPSPHPADVSEFGPNGDMSGGAADA